MPIFKKPKSITITHVEGAGEWNIEPHGDMNATEACDALLAAYCTIAATLVNTGSIPAEMIKNITMSELDNRLSKEEDAPCEKETN